MSLPITAFQARFLASKLARPPPPSLFQKHGQGKDHRFELRFESDRLSDRLSDLLSAFTVLRRYEECCCESPTKSNRATRECCRMLPSMSSLSKSPGEQGVIVLGGGCAVAGV